MDPKHQKLVEEIRKTINDINPEKMLVNMSACDYHVTPDTNTWYENPVFAMYADLPPKKIALIITQNWFVNAFFDAGRASEKVGTNTKLQYFEDYEKARKWLNH